MPPEIEPINNEPAKYDEIELSEEERMQKNNPEAFIGSSLKQEVEKNVNMEQEAAKEIEQDQSRSF